MKLDKAIEILTLDVKGSTKIDYHDWQAAIKLGIEASKAYAQARRLGLPLRCDLLPEETED